MFELILFLVCSIGLMIFLGRFTGKEFYDPLFLAPAYWIVFITFSIFVSKLLDLPFYWMGVIPIGLLLLAFISGSFVMRHIIFSISPQKDLQKYLPGERNTIPAGRIKWMIIVFSGIGLLAVYLQLQFLKIQIKSFADLLQTACTISSLRYNGGEDMPKYGLILMAFLYSAGFFGGVYSIIGRGIFNKVISLLPFVVIMIFTLTNGVKSGFLFLLIIWISGFASAYIFERNGKIKNVKKLLLKAMIILVFVFSLIPITQFLRGGKPEEKIKFMSAGTISYFVSFNAFTIWYNSYKHDELTGFKYTLSGVHNYFFGQREAGLYGLDNVEVGNYNKSPVITNVYTMARGLIEDFNIFGAMAILFATGLIMQFLYVLTKRKNLIAMCIMALFYSILFWSFTVNIINYNTIIFSWIISLVFTIFLRSNKPVIQPEKNIS